MKHLSITMTKKKEYCFDYIKENINRWSPDVKKNITKDMIGLTPYGIFVWNDITRSLILDWYGEPIEDFEDWKRQREEYIDKLYNELKGK